MVVSKRCIITTVVLGLIGFGSHREIDSPISSDGLFQILLSVLSKGQDHSIEISTRTKLSRDGTRSIADEV